MLCVSGTHEIYWALRESIVFGVLVLSVLAFHGWDRYIFLRRWIAVDRNSENHLIELRDNKLYNFFGQLTTGHNL